MVDSPIARDFFEQMNDRRIIKLRESDRTNIYFPVYRKIEKEVLRLASAIFFCDAQTGVYSLDIADLLVRCAIEVESIAKDIYRLENDGKEVTPGDCFRWLDSKWEISKKKIDIVSPYFHFDSMKSLFPFDYRKDSKEDYYSIYNSIKHDRAKNLDKATVYALIRVLGALYILNLYYKNDRIQLQDDRYGKTIDKSFGSSIFSVYVAPCRDIAEISSDRDISPEQCIYHIIRKESEYAFSLSFLNQFGELQSTTIVMVNVAFQEYAASCVDKRISVDDLWRFIEGLTSVTAEQIKNEFIRNNKVSEFTSVSAYRMKATFWAELNK